MMTATVVLKVPMAELLQMMKDYERDNGEALSIDKARKIYTEQFLADKSNYIDTDRVLVHFE